MSKRQGFVKWSRRLGKSLAILLAIFILLLLSLRIPYIQNYITSKVVSQLSSQLNTEISIENIYMNFIDNACAEKIFLASQNGDTLLYADQLNVDIGFFKLLSNTIELDDINLSGVRIKIKENQDSVYNFQFLIDAFASEDTSTTEGGFLVDLNLIELFELHLSAELQSGMYDVKMQDALINIDKFDLDNSEFELAEIALVKPKISLISYPVEGTVMADSTEQYTAFPLEGFGYEIALNKFTIEDGYLLMKDSSYNQKNSFNADFIKLENLHTSLSNISVTDTMVHSDLENFSVVLNDTVKISDLQADLNFTNSELILSEAKMTSNRSQLAMNMAIDYQAFNDLANLDENLKIRLDAQPSKLYLQDFQYFLNTAIDDPELKNLVYNELNLSGKIEGTLEKLDIKEFILKISNTNVAVNGFVTSPLETENLGFQDFSLKGFSEYEDYKVFLSDSSLQSQLKELGTINLDVLLNGNLNTLELDKFDINTEAMLRGSMAGTIKNVTDTELLSYNLNINNIRTGKEDFKMFLDSIPYILEDFDSLNYSGNLKGNLTDYDLNGEFESPLGGLKTDLFIQFNEEYTDASYQGEFSMEQFDLGEMINNDSLGRISITANIDGSGIDTDSIKAEINGSVEQVEFNGYNYHDIKIDGLVDGNKFTGTSSIDDENIKISFDGKVDLNPEVPIFAFELLVDTINLGALNLYDNPLSIHSKISADFSANDLDDADGDFVIRDIRMSKGDQKYNTDSIIFNASLEDEIRLLSLRSEFMQADIEGDYKVALLPETILDFFDRYFPLKRFLGSTPKEDSILNNQELQEVSNDNINANIKLYNIEPIALFFDIPIKEMDSTSMDFKLDAPNDLTEFTFYMPYINYDGYKLDSIYAFADNNPEQVNAVFSIDSIYISEAISISEIDLVSIFKDQKARVKAAIQSEPEKTGLGFDMEVSSDGNQNFTIDLINNFILNDKSWTISQDSSIVWADSKVTIPKVGIENNENSLNVSGDSEELLLNFKDFGLDNLVDIVGIDSLDVSGLMNGRLTVGLKSEVPVTGALGIRDIYFNEFQIGNMNLAAKKDGDNVDTRFQVRGQEMNLEGGVKYNMVNEVFDGIINIRELQLEPFQPLMVSYTENLKGNLNGELFLEGTIEEPVIMGVMNMEEVSAFIKPLGTDYNITTGTISLFEGSIQPNITLKDASGRLSYLDGSIYHRFMTDMEFDLTFDAESFTFLNSKPSKSEMFYGNFTGQVYAEITGDVDLPSVDATVVALEETDLTIQMLADQATLSNENYIIFFDGQKVSSVEEIDSIADLSYNVENFLELNLRLSTSEKALYHVIVDPITGDKLDIQGTGDLLVKIPNNEDMTINGEFTVSQGNYRLSYENTIRRNFAIDRGSKINFAGDPMNAILNMRAIYETTASTVPLVSNSSNSLTSDTGGSNKEDVQVILFIDGTITKPELQFDIQIPDISSGPVGNSTTTALATLRQNETQLLEQVFSLILFGSFTSGSNSGGNISTVGTSTAVSSVGYLINSQLNKLANRANGLELNFELDQYKDRESNNNQEITEVGVGLQQRLLNDRLIVSVGGNANLGLQNESNTFTSFAGDFVLQYLLTEEGKYRVKVFQRNDYNALDNSNVWKTGVGLSFKNSFGKVKKDK